MQKLKTILEEYYSYKNTPDELSEEKPDPLFVAKTYQHKPYTAEIALICALLAYGNARAIVKMLQSLDFTLLESVRKITQSDESIFPYYRFQTQVDIKALCHIIALMCENGGLYPHFLQAYKNAPINSALWDKSKNAHHARMLYGIYECIEILYHYAKTAHLPLSKGLCFALGTSHSAYLVAKNSIPSHTSALKRWNMLLRWLVRKDHIDMGIWQEISPSHLILPLDTHTFTLCIHLGILRSRVYNLQSALQASDSLALMCEDDPIKYDFALYRLGQSGKYKHLFI